MLAAFLMLCVAAAIAYPFVQKRFLPGKSSKQLESVDNVDDAEAPPAAVVRGEPLREELCPQCSRLNPPGQRLCYECHGPMPIVKMSHFWDGIANDDLVREGVQAGVLLLAMIIAMTLANFLPVGGKIVIVLLTVAALGYRMMTVLYN